MRLKVSKDAAYVRRQLEEALGIRRRGVKEAELEKERIEEIRQSIWRILNNPKCL